MKNKKGFTLVELLVVMAILAILALLAVPRFVLVQKQANQRTFLTNHRMLASMVTLYSSAHEGKTPTSIIDLSTYVDRGGTLASAGSALGQQGVTFTISGSSLVGTLAAAQSPTNSPITTSFKMK